MFAQSTPVPVHFQSNDACFDDRELQRENAMALQVRCVAAVASIDAAMEAYGLSRHFAEQLAALTPDEMERLSRCGYSLLEIDTDRFVELMNTILGSQRNQYISVRVVSPEQKEQIITENRSSLVRRWHLTQISKIEALRRLHLVPSTANLLQQATYDNLEEISRFAIPLFKLTENSALLHLAKVAQSPKDLAILSVLRDD